MTSINKRIDSILKERKNRLKEIQEYQNHWISLNSSINGLHNALSELSAHPSGPEGARELAQRLATLPSHINSEIGSRIGRVKRRFQRETINIGVGGRARVGKSTLLQNLSGLEEDQIPTGEDMAVTAVRSRIFHSEKRAYADVSFHSWESFRKDLLFPYFEQLSLGVPPISIEGFRQFSMPPRPTSTSHQNAETQTAFWDRLADMQRSLATYEQYLTGNVQKLDLEGVRKFVAYPTKEAIKAEMNGIPAQRCYLAVKDAQIYCRFPKVDVSRIGIIDLPGTGEIVAGGENRHVADLEDEVDFVFQLCRPSRYSMWEAQDAKTLELVKESRCGAKPEDFCWILLNSGGATENQLEAFELEIDKKTSGYTHRRLNAIDPQSVHNDAIQPALEHLANRLPEMDRAAMKFAIQGLEDALQNFAQLLVEVQHMLDSMPPAASSEGKRRQLALQLKKEVGVSFYDLLEELKERVEDGDTQAFEEAVAECENECESQCQSG